MIASLRAGDEVVVASIDRLARSLVDLVGLIEMVNGRGASLVFVKEGLPFNGTADSMQRFQLQIMGAVAEFERSIINERAAEGREAAKAHGVKFGRASVLSPKDVAEVVRQHANGKSIRALALDFDVGRATIARALERSDAA